MKINFPPTIVYHHVLSYDISIKLNSISGTMGIIIHVAIMLQLMQFYCIIKEDLSLKIQIMAVSSQK